MPNWLGLIIATVKSQLLHAHNLSSRGNDFGQGIWLQWLLILALKSTETINCHIWSVMAFKATQEVIGHNIEHPLDFRAKLDPNFMGPWLVCPSHAIPPFLPPPPPITLFDTHFTSAKLPRTTTAYFFANADRVERRELKEAFPNQSEQIPKGVGGRDDHTQT